MSLVVRLACHLAASIPQVGLPEAQSRPIVEEGWLRHALAINHGAIRTVLVRQHMDTMRGIPVESGMHARDGTIVEPEVSLCAAPNDDRSDCCITGQCQRWLSRRRE